ncbi:MAG: hypothetical protein QM680_02220 [Luteolibacter sp.]
MAWRIEKAVVQGVIDNTVEGRTTGRIWLAGRDEPLILSLDGDCWRDLAGARLEFENPSAQASDEFQVLDMDQSGVVGDMTASRKVKMPLISDDEIHQYYKSNREIPYEWRNMLYLEWFSEINGRVVLEASDFILQVSSHEWQMDEDDEEAQKLANLNSMRDFMAQVIRRREPDGTSVEPAGELDEFAWEERLKESDRLTEAYQEVLEKYMEDVDSEQKEAFVMGWDGLLDALAERDEQGLDDEDEEDEEDFQGSYFSKSDDEDDDEDDEEEDFEDFGFNEEDNHPLQVRAQELAMRAMDLVDREAGPGTAPYTLVSQLLQISGKLAGVLNGRGSGYEAETGFVLAVLKRCLNWINEAVGACQEILNLETDPDQKAALERLRASIFEIRDGIVELRRELK